jgi:hypothetical protein
MGSPVVATAKALAIADMRIPRDQAQPNALAVAFEEIYKYNPVHECLKQITQPNVDQMIAIGQRDAEKKAGPSAPG